MRLGRLVLFLALILTGFFLAGFLSKPKSVSEAVVFREDSYPEKPRLATLTVINPPVEMKINGEWSKVESGVSLATGDSVRTLSGSKAEIAFREEAVIRIDQESEISLSSVTEMQTKLYQAIGSTYSKVKKFIDPEQVYEVETPMSVASVRGTAFGVLVDENKESKVFVTSGVVAVAPIKIVENKRERLESTPVVSGQTVVVNAEVVDRIQKDGLPLDTMPTETVITPVEREWIEENTLKDQDFDLSVNLSAGLSPILIQRAPTPEASSTPDPVVPEVTIFPTPLPRIEPEMGDVSLKEEKREKNTEPRKEPEIDEVTMGSSLPEASAPPVFLLLTEPAGKEKDKDRILDFGFNEKPRRSDGEVPTPNSILTPNPTPDSKKDKDTNKDREPGNNKVK